MEPAIFCVCQVCEATFSKQPNRCQSCAHPISGTLDFCGQCLSHAPAFDNAYTLYDYQDSVAQLVTTLKYKQQLCIGNYFAHKLAEKYQTMQHYDAIIPMPLSRQRIRERGFNQVLELLSVLKKKPNLVIDTHSVCRIKATQPLATLNPKQRQKEIRGAFQANSLSYQRILLVDDVMTTGASLNELAKTLLRSGVKHCDVLTLSRAKE